ncbi:MAG: hypothetical protein IAF94_10380 [Pirellulaceae bacterium]|nr:hypothetical protein [Pirellulaceae bacterium]
MRSLVAKSAGITALLAIAWLTTDARAEDSLGQLREEVRTEDPPAPSRDRAEERQATSYDPYCDPSNEDTCSDGWGELLLPAFVVAGTAATAPFWGPPMLVGDSRLVDGYFPRYPYKHRGGYMWIGDHVPDVYVVGVRARSDFGTSFGRFDWVGGNLLVESTARWGGETDFRVLYESLTGNGNDSMTLGDANLFYRFAQSDQFQARTGLGFNYLADPADTNYGFNFTYAADWYPVKPVIVSAELDLGWLGQESLFHLRVTEGVNWKYGEAYVGYDYYDVGNFQVGGMVAGVRLWF